MRKCNSVRYLFILKKLIYLWYGSRHHDICSEGGSNVSLLAFLIHTLTKSFSISLQKTFTVLPGLYLSGLVPMFFSIVFPSHKISAPTITNSSPSLASSRSIKHWNAFSSVLFVPGLRVPSVSTAV